MVAGGGWGHRKGFAAGDHPNTGESIRHHFYKMPAVYTEGTSNNLLGVENYWLRHQVQ